MAATASADFAAAAVTPDCVDLDFNIDADEFFDADTSVIDDRSAMAATATDEAVAAAAVTPDLDVFDFGDLAAADEFCNAYSAFVANADAKRVGGRAGTGGGWLAGLTLSSGGGGGGGGEGSLEGSPDSVVTTDGPLAEEEAMSAIVAELERYLMDDDGDGDAEEVFCGDDDLLDEHICADDFFGDLLCVSDFNSIVTAASGDLLKGVEGNGDGDRVEEHICVDDYYFGDLLGSSDDFDGIVFTSSSASALHDGVGDNDDGDVLAAREDEPASRKRASRHMIRGATMPPWWAQPEVTIQVPTPWPPAAAVLLCCM